MLTSAVLLLTASLAAEPAEAKIPENVRAAMTFLVGEWQAEGSSNDLTFTSTETVRWAPGGHCVIKTLKGSFYNGTCLGGWDPSTKEYVETWYLTEGVRIENRYSLIGEKVWEGTSILQEPSGKATKYTVRTEKTAEGLVFTAKSDKETYVSRAKRVPKQAK